MKKGFTLLELIVVIIIVGVLATLGFGQYTRVVEKGRTAEAKSNLGMIRKLQLAYYQERGAYAVIAALGSGLPSGASGACANTGFYFNYTCASASGTCTAYRCTAGGKTPNAAAADAYNISLTVAGDFGGTAGYY